MIPVKIDDFKTLNYGQTKFDILPKLVLDQYKKHIGSIYVDQVKVTSTNIIISIDQFYSPVLKRVRSYMNGAQAYSYRLVCTALDADQAFVIMNTED